MYRPATKIAMACALLFVFAGMGARAAGRTTTASTDSLKSEAISPSRLNPNVRPFKLKGGGRIDLATFAFNFAGQATYLGQFTAAGQLDPVLGEFAGTMTAADGDTVNWHGLFSSGPEGAIEATLTLDGGTGRFVQLDGVISGPVELDEDFMFTLNLEGPVRFADLGF